MDRNHFLGLLKNKLVAGGEKSANLIKHSLGVEICLRDLADYFEEDKEVWGLAGLLHDWDYYDFGSDPKNHGLKAAKELEELGLPPEICRAIAAHNEMTETSRDSLLEKAIHCVDPATGLIVSATLVLPSRKLADLDADSLLKRFNEKRFAAGANREIIGRCSEINLELKEFLEICLTAMKKISGNLGL